MTRPVLLVVVLACLYMHQVFCQISFSTHWGTGKRSPVFDSQNQPLSNILADASPIEECYSKLKYNLLKYMTLKLEKELQHARECLMAEKDVEYK
ncbi:hypothetical protein DPMN_164622 [Dreissena polymorpha]|uniref:Uncharacterized protein n=1 Tax=Dreissena polymorpha TaxID=45954 RepID=A0A9D4ITV8_DREPO|nr:hypothetical protein DPMN_164622 [Dreissena polymorpha]